MLRLPRSTFTTTPVFRGVLRGDHTVPVGDYAIPTEFGVSADGDGVADRVAPEAMAPVADCLTPTSPIVLRRRADRAIVDRTQASPVLHLHR
jgi:hypothetical protein